MISSPTSSPQQQRSGSGLRRKRWNSAEETTSNDEQVGDHLLHLPSSSTNIPATTSTIPATPTSRCRSTSTDSTLFRRRTFAFQPNDVPYPRYVDSFQPSYVDSTPSPSPTTSQNLSLPSISPSSPALPQSRSQTQAHSRRRRALSDSHLFPSTRRSSSTTTSLHARAHPATYLAYWLDLADSASLFDSSNDSQEENVSDEEEGSFDDDGDDDDMESHVRREGLMNSDSDEDDVEMYQDSIPDNVSLPSTTSSFHLSTLFEDSDSDEDDENSPLHIEHYAPSPTPPLSLNSSSSSSPTSSTTSIPTTNTDHQGRVSLLPPFTQDQFLSFLADRSQASRSSSRTCTGVYPVHPDDDSSSSEDDSDSDDDMEVNGILVRNVAERTVQSRDPWREMDIRRRGGGEESQALNGAGGGNETAGFESGNSLGLEMWLSDGMPVSPEFESWRRARDESRESSGFSGHEFVEEEDEDEDDVEMESFVSSSFILSLPVRVFSFADSPLLRSSVTDITSLFPSLFFLSPPHQHSFQPCPPSSPAIQESPRRSRSEGDSSPLVAVLGDSR